MRHTSLENPRTPPMSTSPAPPMATAVSSSLSSSSLLLSSSLPHQEQRQHHHHHLHHQPQSISSGSSSSSETLRVTKEPMFDHRNTSTRDPETLAVEILHVLTEHGITFKRKNFRFVVEGNSAKAESLVSHRMGLDLERDIIERYEESGEISPSSPPRVIEHYLNDEGDASDSSDGGARDSLEDTPEEEEMRRGVTLPAGMSSSTPTTSSSTPSPTTGTAGEKRVRFEVEICRLGPGLHGLRMKRLEGDVWLYKDLCDNFLAALRL